MTNEKDPCNPGCSSCRSNDTGRCKKTAFIVHRPHGDETVMHYCRDANKNRQCKDWEPRTVMQKLGPVLGAIGLFVGVPGVIVLFSVLVAGL